MAENGDAGRGGFSAGRVPAEDQGAGAAAPWAPPGKTEDPSPSISREGAAGDLPGPGPGGPAGLAPGRTGAGGASSDDPDRDEPARRTRRRRRTRRVLYGALVLLCAGVLLAAGTTYWAYQHYTGRVDRIPNAFPTGVPESALPPPSKDGSQTFLLVGLDARSDLPTTGKDAKAPEWKPGAQRSDTMMLVHLPADHKHAYVVSLPRDSWVSVPGHGKAKLNAAFSWGGPPLLIDTVQRLTKVKIDHLAVIDWSGFKKLTDAVGGVDITVDKTVSRLHGGGPGAVWTAGTHHMDGDEALDYVRERYGLPNGDLDRAHRQQNFLRAVLVKMLSGGTFSNPLKLKRTLDQVTSVVSVDDQLSNGDLRGLVWGMRDVRSSDMAFMNAPVGGFDMIQKQSVVLLDANAADELWESMRNDTMTDFVATHSLDTLGDKVS
ncbi:LCP family protein [Actinacidiphila sp. ITFR-21]|uniref:LCP family protein n=1 Tax=Actinacidiphila sp. ITFR-21 TaxID=3075199 RepID=UPI00288AA1C3|nr:LCP family protein [Streptomyces sp. ITFR-21]WNI15797.1 LCP family protein [Streptomyces sp. ITFR-21]